MPDQFSLFESDGAELGVDDLDGLLLGTGHVVRRDDRARVSVLVDDEWRAQALRDELTARELAAGYEANREDGPTWLVRTELSERLLPVADRWQPGRRRGAGAIRLTGAVARLWVLCAGRRVEAGYQLGLAPSEDFRWPRSGAALADAGLSATLIGPRGGGPAYRLTSAKRLARLAALAGSRPEGAAETDWP